MLGLPIEIAIPALLFWFFLTVLPVVLLARISHWAFHTQQKLDRVNATLAMVVAQLKENGRG